jgi:DNA gyrase/topoisomerase IV subunit B
MSESEYESANVKILTGVEAIRKRPGMYVGELPINELCAELLSNCCDQISAGLCSEVTITLVSDYELIVEDNGPGMRDVDVDGMPLLTYATTQYRDDASVLGHAPHDHVGLFRLGLMRVAALAEHFEVQTISKQSNSLNLERQIVLSKGEVVVAETRKTSERACGTRVHLIADLTVLKADWFGAAAINRTELEQTLSDLSAFFPGAAFKIVDHRVRIFKSDDGLASQLTAPREPAKRFSFEVSTESVRCSGVVDFGRNVFSRHDTKIGYVNWGRSKGGHINAMLEAFNQVLKECALEPDHVASILQAARYVCRIQMADPHYRSPTREFLTDSAATQALQPLIAEAFRIWASQRQW